MPEQMYLIWSHEHNAWWAPFDAGYTTSYKDAGRYTRDEAIERTVDHIPAGEEVAIRDFGRDPIDYIHGRKS